MKDIQPIHFSKMGSYIQLMHSDSMQMADPNYSGLFLLSMHGKAGRMRNVLRIIPKRHGKEIPYTYRIGFYETVMTFEEGSIHITFSDNALLIEGRGNDYSIVLDQTLPGPAYTICYNYIDELAVEKIKTYVINSYRTYSRYLVYVTKGDSKLYQNYHGDEYSKQIDPYSYIEVSVKDSSDIVISDIPRNMIPIQIPKTDYDKSLKETKEKIESFISAYPAPKKEYEAIIRLAIYNIYALTVGPCGLLTRNTVYLSVTYNGGYSHDSSMIALALGLAHPELAYDQLMVYFDNQDEYGSIPAMLTDGLSRDNFAKPPVQGIYLRNIYTRLQWNKQKKEKLYESFRDYINYFLTCKDSNQDGICEYHYGHDGAFDNGSVYDTYKTTDVPSLSTYLIESMNFLARLGKDIDKEEEAEAWKQKAEMLTQKTLEYFVTEDLDVKARETVSGNFITCGSIEPYILIALGKRLPEDVYMSIKKRLLNEFLTDYGFPTEKTQSAEYQSDGYCRGPIWAYSTVHYVDGLYDGGEKKLAKDIATRFCKMVKNSNAIYETYDALTGAGLRDGAHNLTAGALIYLYYKYINE